MQYPGSPIKIGSKNGEAVKAIKEQLNIRGYGTLDENNPIFGSATDTMVRYFQKNKLLLVDGVVGELTWERLFDEPVGNVPNAHVIREAAIQIAETQLAVRERTGKNDGEEVESYLKAVGLGKGYAWCAAFVYWCYEKAAAALGVPNPLVKTGGVLKHLQLTKGTKVKANKLTPQRGDIFFMNFGNGSGHEGMVTKVVGNKVFTIEGNTNDGGSREGDGVYNRSRTISSIEEFVRYE